MSVNGPRIYFEIPILGGIPITETTVSLFVVTLILCVCGYLLGRNLTKRPGKLQVLTEKGITMLRNLVIDTMGAHNVGWVPFIGTIFLSSLLGSLIGMTGFLKSTTANASVILTWSVVVSVLIWYNSIKANGFWGWLRGFTEPIAVMTPMNLVSEIAQPISMTFRHFGNVVGGSVISSMLYTALAGLSSVVLSFFTGSGLVTCISVLLFGILLLVIGFGKKKLAAKIFGTLLTVIGTLSVLEYFEIFGGVPFLQIGLPAILSLYFDIFSGFIQAFVFCLLTMVYISGACPAPADTVDEPPAANQSAS